MYIQKTLSDNITGNYALRVCYILRVPQHTYIYIITFQDILFVKNEAFPKPIICPSASPISNRGVCQFLRKRPRQSKQLTTLEKLKKTILEGRQNGQ